MAVTTTSQYQKRKSYFFGYIRLSSSVEQEKENEKTNKIETQKKAIQDFYRKKFLKKEKEEENSCSLLDFYIDNGVSGTTPFTEREEGFKKLANRISQIREEEKKTTSPIHLITFHPDRFSRDDLVFNLIIDFLSKKCVKIYYVSEEGEGDPMILKFKSIIAEQERRNTIRRINQFYEIHNNWDKRVGFGWDYDSTSKIKKENLIEYPILQQIKQAYEEGQLVNDIAVSLNQQKLFKRDGKQWNTTSLSFVITKNNFEWGIKNEKMKTAFEKDNYYRSEGCEDKIYIKDFEKAVENKRTEEEFFSSFGKKVNEISFFTDGKKVTSKIFNKYFVKNNSKEEEEKKVIQRIIFWLNDQIYYSNSEITKKIKSEFPSLENLSEQSIWRRIKKAKKIREKMVS